MSKAQQVYQSVLTHLQKTKFRFEPIESSMMIHVEVNTEDLPIHAFIRILEDKDVLQIICPQGSKVPEDKRIETAVAVAVANYGMINGGFDLDMSDGSLHFRLTHSYQAALPDDDQLHYLIGCALTTMNQYNDRFFMLSKGMMDLEKFIEMENSK